MLKDDFPWGKALGAEFQAGAAEVRLKPAFLQNPSSYEGPLPIVLKATDQPRVKDTRVLSTWAQGNLVLLGMSFAPIQLFGLSSGVVETSVTQPNTHPLLLP